MGSCIQEAWDTQEKDYGQQVHDVECGVFTPQVFSTTGSMGLEETTFYKHLADMIFQK